jgi:hypothetical protein
LPAYFSPSSSEPVVKVDVDVVAGNGDDDVRFGVPAADADADAARGWLRLLLVVVVEPSWRVCWVERLRQATMRCEAVAKEGCDWRRLIIVVVVVDVDVEFRVPPPLLVFLG